MSFPPVFAQVRQRPGMHLPAITYAGAASYVLGYDAATNYGLLLGFREWLIVRLGMGNNLAWTALAHELIQRQAQKTKPTDSSHIADDDLLLVEGLFNVIEMFLRERDQPDGLRRIFAEYERWLRTQDWYGPLVATVDLPRITVAVKRSVWIRRPGSSRLRVFAMTRQKRLLCFSRCSELRLSWERDNRLSCWLRIAKGFCRSPSTT